MSVHIILHISVHDFVWITKLLGACSKLEAKLVII